MLRRSIRGFARYVELKACVSCRMKVDLFKRRCITMVTYACNQTSGGLVARFGCELQELQVLYSDQDLKGDRGKLCDFLMFLKDMELDSATPHLYKRFSLVATIGATSACVERSFSCGGGI